MLIECHYLKVANIMIVHLLLVLIGNSQLIIQNEVVWQDDFQYDSNGLSGWNIVQTNGYEIPISNPIININNNPKYHGPFPQNYKLERQVICNTSNDTFFFASYRLQFCNTDKNDISIMKIKDSLQNDILIPPRETQLNNGNLLSVNDLSFVQNATYNHYYNHSSSTSNIPYCANTSINQWYRPSTAITESIAITGTQTYSLIIEINMTDADEYVLISDILMQCIDISTPAPIQTIPPTSNPTIHPSIYPTIQPTSNPTTQPTIQPSLNPTTQTPTVYPTINPSIFPTINPTTYPSIYPTIYPSKIPTLNPTNNPSQNPTTYPTTLPTSNPTINPSVNPSIYPTTEPSYSSLNPSLTPTLTPTDTPTSRTQEITDGIAKKQQKRSLLYIYITLGILSFLAIMLCICCIIFWVALHLHKKATTNDLKESTETVQNNHTLNKNIDNNNNNNKEINVDMNELDKTSKTNDSNFSDVINIDDVEMIEYCEHNFGEYNIDYNKSDDVINLQYKASDTTHTSF